FRVVVEAGRKARAVRRHLLAGMRLDASSRDAERKAGDPGFQTHEHRVAGRAVGPHDAETHDVERCLNAIRDAEIRRYGKFGTRRMRRPDGEDVRVMTRAIEAR